MKIMRSKRVRSVVVFLFVAGAAVQADAAWWDIPLAIGLAGVTVAAGAASLGVGVFVAGPGELGVAVVAGATTASVTPPPDQSNYAVQATPALNQLAFTPDPNASAALNAAAQSYDSDLSVAVQNTLGAEQSLARLEGAELVGTPTDVANQQMWLQQFQNQTDQALIATGHDLQTFASLYQTEFPSLYNLSISASQLASVVSAEGSGTFGTAEQQAISQLGLGAFEVNNYVSPYLGGITSSDIAQYAPLTFGQALSMESAALLSVPEPSSVTLLAIGSLVAAYLVGRQRRVA